jgi:hypothetical protein
MSKKAQTAEFFRAYELTTGRSLPFIPESYVLPDDRLSLLRRLTLGSASSLRGAGVSGSDISGDNEPWVVKLSAIDVSHRPSCCLDSSNERSDRMQCAVLEPSHSFFSFGPR